MVTNFLRLLSVTIHSTWSRRQFVQGDPFSTTSQRTLRALQQQQAFDARRFTGRLWEERPATEALRFPESESVMVADALLMMVAMMMTGGDPSTFDNAL